MADVTISSLSNAVPNLGSIIPISQGGGTYSTLLQQLTSLPFIPKAFGAFNGYTLTKIGDGFNFKEVTMGAIGNFFVSFNTPLISADYTVNISANSGGTAGGIILNTSLGNYVPSNLTSYYNPTLTTGFYCQTGKTGIGGTSYGYVDSTNGGWPKIYFTVYSAV